MFGNGFGMVMESILRSSVTDPLDSSSYRVRRGGSWNYYARDVRVSNRSGFDPLLPAATTWVFVFPGLNRSLEPLELEKRGFIAEDSFCPFSHRKFRPKRASSDDQKGETGEEGGIRTTMKIRTKWLCSFPEDEGMKRNCNDI